MAPSGQSDRIAVQARLPADLVDRLDAEAERRLVSRTRLIQGAVERLLDSEQDSR
jgi:metal-responsive CopG/Arc/MetJ family transcriptional regulator